MSFLDLFTQTPMVSKGYPLASGVWMGPDETKVASAIFYNEDGVLTAFCGKHYAEDEFQDADLPVAEKAYYILNRLVRRTVCGCHDVDERTLHIRSLVSLVKAMQDEVTFSSVRNVRMFEPSKGVSGASSVPECLNMLNQIIVFYPLTEDPRWITVPTPDGNSFYATILYRPMMLTAGLFLKYELHGDGETARRLYLNEELSLETNNGSRIEKIGTDFGITVDFIEKTFQK